MTKFEKIFYIILSLLVTYAIYYLSNHYCQQLNYQKFFELFITTFSIIIGFLLTISTLLHSIRNEKIEFIRKSGGMKSLNSSLRNSIYLSFIAILFSIFSFLFEDFFNANQILIYPIIFLNILSFLISLNFMKIFLKIMSTE
ncbi:hypothetical protein B0A75_00525 [Flavobacterium oncorhynchi]|uniref:Uncharacterized protein n=1 Tax=Flavobacterium oncorhynchi TaxID=728056 RepID=A0A226IAB3_9FLAO|nr:hypothetical protein [Flavobacterium oncorhynchi]OXB03460.1 hypothetical protein B0A75_00525 [Flavobacterium oncorhynchi]